MNTIAPEQHVAGPDAFRRLQASLAPMFERLRDPHVPRTILVVPSLSLGDSELARIPDPLRYEERLLCLLLLLQQPQTSMVLVTSRPIPDEVIDYYLRLVPGPSGRHARRRLTLVSCHDASPTPLTAKILARPRLLRRLREALPGSGSTYMTCYNVTELERSLALSLDIPVDGCDPGLKAWGTKSGSRKLFRRAGLSLPDGAEDLRGPEDAAEALADLKARRPRLRRAVVKLNEGSAGDGNAVFDFSGAPSSGLAAWVRARLPCLAFVDKGMSWVDFQRQLALMGGIAEEFIESGVKHSPSAQFNVDPLGRVEAISTHDQVLGGRSGQVCLGCRFPADRAYRLAIQEAGARVARLLAGHGVVGPFGIDFVSVKERGAWRHLAVEVNLRKGGTTHPFFTLHHLVGGRYDERTGRYLTPSGHARCYFCTDDLVSDRLRGLLPADVIGIATANGLHFDPAVQEGVCFHQLGGLSEFGRLGVLCIASSRPRSEALYRATVALLEREAAS